MVQLDAPWPAAIGVSGGADSIGLMHLLRDWADAERRAPPVVLTVDHGLQPNSASTAAKVRGWARNAGLEGRVLTWAGGKPDADIEAAARAARYELMGRWCRSHGISALFVAHTRDDQAETFLLRLGRGSGVDGLAAMRRVAPFPVQGFPGLRLIRPLLGFGREVLRLDLQTRGQAWVEDPMNQDDRFARVRVRAAMDALSAAGLSAARIADAAAHLERARDALDAVTAAVLLKSCLADGNAILLDIAAVRAAPREIGLRVLAQVLMGVSHQAYRPRFARLEKLFDTLVDRKIGGGRTLHGCRVRRAPKAKAAGGAEILEISPEKARSAVKSSPVARNLQQNSRQ